MAIPTSGQDEEGPPYQSFAQVRAEKGAQLSPAARRLYWPLGGKYPSDISVMRTLRYDGHLDAFFKHTASDSGGGTWHEIATLPVTEPKVSSIVATLRDLNQWESDWVAWHTGNSGPECNPEYVTYGDLDDEDRPYAKEPNEDGSWEVDSDTEFLARCCGEDRPLRKMALTIEVTPSADNSFVTVRDYVSVVHPWLVGVREDILRAKKIARPSPHGGSVPDNEWMVSCLTGPDHEIMAKDAWLDRHRGPRPMDASKARFLERIGARIEQ
ncbi:hypothetical protein LIA77_10655 [Sarocladium implicatum]|nr:hypothetical protein LIA77_10655 [Sarocladium implicatum]